MSAGLRAGTNNDGYLQINGTDVLTALSSGNIGIGTTNPSSLLHINGATVPLRVTHTGSNGIQISRNSKFLGFNANYSSLDTHSTIGSDAGMALAFTTNNDNERLRITSSGNVGIGTTNPSEKLDVNGVVSAFVGTFGAGGYKLKYYTGSNDSRSWWMIGDLHAYGDFGIRQSTTQSGSTFDTKFYIHPSGNVGIGRTSIGARLDVSSDATTTTTIRTSSSRIINPNNSGSEITGAQITLGGNIILSERQPNTAFSDRTDIVLVTNTGYGLGQSDKIRITAGGAVGIGTNPINAQFHVIANHPSGHAGVKIQRTDSNITSLGFFSPTDSRDGIIYTNNTGSLVFETPNSIVMTPVNGAVAGTFGSTGLSFPSGKGIDFSANANAAGMTSELLDDYEEGTFTPQIVGWTGTYSIQYGMYTKVGRMVTIQCEVQTNGGTGSFNTAYPGISNLPFARDNTTPSYRAMGVFGIIGTATYGANQIGAGLWDAHSSTTELFPNNFSVQGGVGNFNGVNNANSFGYRSLIVYKTVT